VVTSPENAPASAPLSAPQSGAPKSTDRFVRQHEELMNLGKALGKELDTRTISEDPTRVRKALAAFSGKLRVHAAMEQQALYPRLLSSDDPEVVGKARTLENEIGPLYQSFFNYLQAWSGAGAIQTDIEEFCRETMKQLFQLSTRMRRENHELYPLVDALDRRAARR
jgi:hypothetical protein